MTESEITKNRLTDLSRMSYERGVYTYSDFLTLAEQSDFIEAAQGNRLYREDYELFGGTEGTERVMVRFGSEETLGYSESWPIACIKIEPLNHKFAEKLTHRDVLGSLMNLGIERHLLGDIIMPPPEAEGKNAMAIYLFAKEHIADMLCRELTRIRHTSVGASLATESDSTVTPSFSDVNLQVKSERIDLVVAHIYKLSRSQAAEMFSEKKIFVNGRLTENESQILKADDVVSVRGQGRFVYHGLTGRTKKGNLNVLVSKYV